MGALTIPYMVPLMLGMTYNAYNNRPGVNIYDPECVKNPVVTEAKQMKSTYTVATSQSDVKRALGISGDLTLNIKADIVKIDGAGSYVKKETNFMKTVEIIHVCKYIANVKSFNQDCKPVNGWENSYSPAILGTHTVSSITYGAEMVASLSFTCFNNSFLSEVKGAVKGTLGTGGGINITAEGKLEELKKKLEEKAALSISYYGTVPLRNIASSIEGFRDLTTHFDEHVKEAKLEGGIPLEVQLSPLEDYASSENRDKFQFEKNNNLQDKIPDFGNMLDDLTKSRLELVEFSRGLPYNMEEKHQKEVGRMIKNITLCLQLFYDVCWKLNVSEGPEQLQPAIDAYDFDGSPVVNRYRKLVQRLIQRLNPLIPTDQMPGATYDHFGNNNCTADGARLLYEGHVFSSTEEGTGGMSQYECAPKNPKKGYDLDDGNKQCHLAGNRWPKMGKDDNPLQGPNAKKVSEKGMPCAKCYSPDATSVTTFIATGSCPLTWEEIYTGYVMSARIGTHTTQYVCVDDTPSAGYKMDQEPNSKDALVFTVVREGGSLPKETYTPKSIIRCAVCAMKSNQVSL